MKYLIVATALLLGACAGSDFAERPIPDFPMPIIGMGTGLVR